MNKVTTDKYKQMTQMAQTLTHFMEDLQKRCKNLFVMGIIFIIDRNLFVVILFHVLLFYIILFFFFFFYVLFFFCISLFYFYYFFFNFILDKEFEPYVQKINQIDSNVSELERTVLLLDEYTKRLGLLSSFVVFFICCCCCVVCYICYFFQIYLLICYVILILILK
jgi:hypothetical protein